MKLKIRPIWEYHLIRITPRAKISPGGIVMPPGAKDSMPEIGEVMAIGEGRLVSSGDILSPRVGVGQTVMLHNSVTAREVFIKGEKHLLISEEDIAAVVEEIPEEGDLN